MIARKVDGAWQVSLYVPVFEDGSEKLAALPFADSVYSAMSIIDRIQAIEPGVDGTISIWDDGFQVALRGQAVTLAGTSDAAALLAAVESPDWRERRADALAQRCIDWAQPDWLLGPAGQKY